MQSVIADLLNAIYVHCVKTNTQNYTDNFLNIKICINVLTGNRSINPVLMNSFRKCNLKSRSSGVEIREFINCIQAT